jgi:hypothetical protein
MSNAIIASEITLENCIGMLNIPKDCYVGKRVYKKLFYDNAKLSYSDKKAFQEHLDNITWLYALKPDNIGIKGFADQEREYLEISVLWAQLKESKSADRLINLIHRTIPYPLLLICSYQNSVMLSIAPKRFNLAERGAIVAEEVLCSGWINLSAISPIELTFLKSLAIDSRRYLDFLELYQGWEASFIALACSKHNGEMKIEYHHNAERKDLLDRCLSLQTEITSLRSSIRKETQMNRKVEINTRINQLKQQYNECVKKL